MNGSCRLIQAQTDVIPGEAAKEHLITVVSVFLCDAGEMHEGETLPKMKQMHVRGVALHA